MIKLTKKSKKDEPGVVGRKLNPALPLRDVESVERLLTQVEKTKSYHSLLTYVKNEIQENTREINFDYQINCYMKDGAYALSKAVENSIGFSTQKDKETASGTENPVMLDVTFSDGRSVKVPWGTISLPAFGPNAYIEMQYASGTNTMHIRGVCEKRFLNELDSIIADARNRVATDSIYKGQALKFSVDQDPEFIDLSHIDKTPIFLTPEAKFATQPIEARITRTEECIAAGVDIKLGVLLEGPYGGGKTLYAFTIAKKAIENGWTFVYNANPEDTLKAMEMAQSFCKNGKGVVLFTEDIDKILSTRTDATNKISILMDGGETKSQNVISIFTTNHLERIDPTFLRGKRIGSIVTLEAPDAETAETMMKALLEGEYKGSIKAAAELIAELKIVPAFISEICDKVKSHKIFNEQEFVTEQDIIHAIRGYERQMRASALRAEVETPAEALAKNLSTVIISDLRDEVDSLRDLIEANY